MRMTPACEDAAGDRTYHRRSTIERSGRSRIQNARFQVDSMACGTADAGLRSRICLQCPACAMPVSRRELVEAEDHPAGAVRRRRLTRTSRSEQVDRIVGHGRARGAPCSGLSISRRIALAGLVAASRSATSARMTNPGSSSIASPDRLVHGDQLGAVGEGGLDLDLVDHLRHALHHLVARSGPRRRRASARRPCGRRARPRRRSR